MTDYNLEYTLSQEKSDYFRCFVNGGVGLEGRRGCGKLVLSLGEYHKITEDGQESNPVSGEP